MCLFYHCKKEKSAIRLWVEFFGSFRNPLFIWVTCFIKENYMLMMRSFPSYNTHSFRKLEHQYAQSYKQVSVH